MKEHKMGKGWHKDADPTGEGHAKAGRIGGQKTYSERGPVFYSQISKGRRKKKAEEVEATIPVKDNLDDWF